jgi:electron transfer flavoprotein beta subunit
MPGGLRIAVGVKQVPDLDSIDVDPLTGRVDPGRLLMVMNPADEGALELALRHRDTYGGCVEVFSVGPVEVAPVLRRALGAGADEVLRVWDEADAPPATLAASPGDPRDPAEEPVPATQPDRTGAALGAVLARDGATPDLLLLGHRTVDQGSGLVPGFAAAYLGWPVVTDVASLTLPRAPGEPLRCVRRRAKGVEEDLEVDLPAVVAVLPDLARLREASLPQHLAAQRAEIPVVAPPRASGLGRRGGPSAGEPSPGTAGPAGETRAEAVIPSPRRSVHPRRPRARALFTPPVDAPAHERVRQMMSAGVSRGSGRIVEGTVAEAVEAILGLLRERGFVEPTVGGGTSPGGGGPAGGRPS